MAFFRGLLIPLVDGVNDPGRKKYCPLPGLLLLRRRPSFRVRKTEENGAKKGHAELEAKTSLSALMSWPDVLSPLISALRPPLAVAS